MKLIRITMQDFRQFLGVAIVDFAYDDQKSVTIIHGENGVGKTSILNAIHWCLYGSVLSDFEMPERLVNDVAAKKGVTNARVELLFSHNDTRYRIERVYDQNSRTSTANGFTVIEANNTPIDGIAAVVNRIIPLTMAPYFFFHGEGLSNLGSGTGKNSFREAVRAILGFNHADRAIELLKQIRIKWQKQAAKLEKLDSQSRAALEREAAAQEAIADAEKAYQDADQNLGNVEAELSRINDDIAGIRIQDVDALNTQRQKVEQRKRAIPAALEKITEGRIGLVSKYGWSIFGLSFLQDSAKTLQEFRSDRKIPSEYNDRFINSLLSDGRCICGTPLHAESEARSKVQSMLAGASTSEQEDALTSATGIAENIVDVSDEYTALVTQYLAEEQGLREEAGSLDRTLEELRDKLAEIDQPKLNKLEADRADTAQLAERLRDQRHLCKIALDRAKKDRDEARRKKGTLLDDKTLGKVQLRLDFVDQVISALDDVVRREESSARTEMEEVINERLTKYSRKDYYAEVREDFSFELKKQDGSAVPKSKGERLLLNIAFISSLIQLAKRRTAQRSEYFVQGTVAPFVVDAPFGELDNKYRGAVAEFLPECTEQLVVLLSSSHWGQVVESGLRTRTGEEYVLVSESSIDPGAGKTRDEIEIGGRAFQCSRYGMTDSRTVVEEI